MFVLVAVLAAWVVLVPLISYVNDWSEFSGGGDDDGYYRLAEAEIGGFEGLLDLSKFKLKLEQPGYPWMLHIVSAFTGHELLVYKLFNLFMLVLLGMIWYRIGLLLEPNDEFFARAMLVIVFLLTPLWTYVFFVMKDLTISVIQSWGVLISIEMWLKFRLRHVAYFGIVGILLILFRTALLVQSSLVLALSLGMLVIFRGSSNRLNIAIALVGALSMIGIMMYLSSNPAYMAAMGIHTEARVVSGESFIETSRIQAERSSMNRLYFPVLYLFTETSGFSPNQWHDRNYQWLRGLLAIPWILFVVPFVILGSINLLERRKRNEFHSDSSGNEGIRCLSTPWNTVLMFIASSASISFIVGDTTRWRIQDLPMLAAIAYLGWSTRPKYRVLMLVGWFIFVFLSATLFHLLPKRSQ
jgi:hypothetical protein